MDEGMNRKGGKWLIWNGMEGNGKDGGPEGKMSDRERRHGGNNREWEECGWIVLGKNVNVGNTWECHRRWQAVGVG